MEERFKTDKRYMDDYTAFVDKVLMVLPKRFLQWKQKPARKEKCDNTTPWCVPSKFRLSSTKLQILN